MVIVPTEKRFDWKHAPVVLFIIVILNTIIYFGYQYDDNEKMFNAVSKYDQLGFLKYEWPAYKEFLSAENNNNQLSEMQRIYENAANHPQAYLNLLIEIVSDKGFYDYLQKNAYDVFEIEFVDYWSEARAQINKQMESVSYLSYGLVPKNMDKFTFISSQFLHGSAMHLLGNMFFLIVCGFAVEAAIGHFRFLLFYLVSGVVGGLLFCLVDTESSTPLVGASGAISGVMAMYLGVFRFKKIEFFYWFFIFVGYFRAPALLILPFYIGKELYDFFNDAGSNVAFMAHAGGFVTGAVCMAISWIINPKMLNQEYIEEDQSLPQKQKDLAVVNQLISKYKFQTAVVAVDKFVQKYGESFDVLLVKYNLLKILSDGSRRLQLAKMSGLQNLKPYQLDKIQELWRTHKSESASFSDDELFKLGLVLANEVNYSEAEEIFEILDNKSDKHPLLINLARKLSLMFKEKGALERKEYYDKFVSQLSG